MASRTGMATLPGNRCREDALRDAASVRRRGDASSLYARHEELGTGPLPFGRVGCQRRRQVAGATPAPRGPACATTGAFRAAWGRTVVWPGRVDDAAGTVEEVGAVDRFDTGCGVSGCEPRLLTGVVHDMRRMNCRPGARGMLVTGGCAGEAFVPGVATSRVASLTGIPSKVTPPTARDEPTPLPTAPGLGLLRGVVDAPGVP